MLFNEQEVNNEQALIIAHAMSQVSACDGVNPHESALIADFLSGIDTKENFESLLKKDLDINAAKAALNNLQREMLIEGCWMVAMADGRVSAQEKTMIAKLAADLGVNDIEGIRERVIDAFISSLADIKNVEALAAIAQQLRE